MSEAENAYYRHLFECSHFAIIGMDCTGVIGSWNPMAEEVFGRRSEEALGRHVEEIVPAERRVLVGRAIARAVKRRQVADFEIVYETGGRRQELAVVVTPVMDETGELVGLAAWIRDIARRKHLERQLLEAEKMVSLGTLAAGVAHHFNNIVGGVATYVDFALHSDNPEATRRALEMAAEAAMRVGEITDSLLTFAKKGLRECDLADLTEVVLTFAQLVEKPLAEKNIQLNLRLEPVRVVEVPAPRVHQMLGNLLDNAEQAMPRGGVVTVALGAAANGGGVMLEFSDTGKGIEPGDLGHIFEPFFSREGLIGGGNKRSAGLGLAVVHGIVGELGGRIEVESEVGHGTTFRVYLPARGVADEAREGDGRPGA